MFLPIRGPGECVRGKEPLKRMETCRRDEDEVGNGSNDVIREQGFGRATIISAL
jgi:hypothetical protein